MLTERGYMVAHTSVISKERWQKLMLPGWKVLKKTEDGHIVLTDTRPTDALSTNNPR